MYILFKLDKVNRKVFWVTDNLEVVKELTDNGFKHRITEFGMLI